MGARQSKRSVDITTTPKKEGIPAEGAVVGDAAAPGDGKLERIEETDTKPTTNGIAPHTEAVEDKEKDKDEATEKDKEQQEEVKVEEAKQESIEESSAEVAEVTTPTEGTPASPNAVASSDSKETKKKDKKKKWSFRSISFSKKDKTKPNREETRKNGDVTMDGNMSVQEPLAEGGEEAESATAAASSPVEEKSAASSPSADEQVAAPVVAVAASTTESKEETATASPATAVSPAEEKNEEPTPSAPTPVPSAEDKKEEAIEKVEAAEKKVVEVSPAVGRSVTDPVEVPVFRVQPVVTPSSIIERKTSEDLPSLVPSSPPPTPIDPSPLQQARQAAANATALAEALKLPAKAANEENSMTAPCDTFSLPRADVPQENRIEPVPTIVSPRSPVPSADSPLPADATLVPVKVECPSVIEAKVESRDAKEKEALMNIHDERVEIDAKVERVSERPAILEKVSEHQEGETDKVEETLLVTKCDTTKRLDELFDDKNMKQNESVVSSEVCSIVPKEVDCLISSNVTKMYTCEVPTEENELKCTVLKPLDCGNVKIEMAKGEMEVSNIVAINKVMNETSPDVECQIKNEINSCEGVMKTNVAPNVGYNEKVETRTLPSTEIEINSVCPAIKQCFSSENFEVEKVKSFSDKTPQLVESVEKLSDINLPSIEKCITVKTKESLKDEEVTKQLCESPIELEHDYAKNISQEIKEETMESTSSPTQSESVVISSKNELFIDSEEGPLSVSDDVLVEAKMAMVIPEDDSVEELTDTTESVKVIPETDEEKIENEPESYTALPTEETLISEEMEDIFLPDDTTVVESSNETKTVCVEYNYLPPPPPLNIDMNISNSQLSEFSSTMSTIETESIPTEQKPIIVFSTTIEAEPVITPLSQIEQIEEVENCSSHVSLPDKPCPLDSSEPICSTISEFSDSLTYPSPVQTDTNQLIEPQIQALSESVIRNTHISSDDFISVPEDVSSLDDSLLRCLKAPVFHQQPPISPKDPTEPLLPLSVSPNSQSDVNIAFDTVITTKDCEILSYNEDDRSNRESKTTGSVSLSEPTSYNHSDIESKDRLAAECLAKTKCQEGALSCQLLITGLSTAAQEYHQSVPETEAPVENNVVHDSSTTENIDEAPKVAPPAIPIEAPASPPTAPAITEDVASVTKAIEEIDISDKAVAAAVNECNTNEIIADAHHQNKINEYE